jgi:hypothetical protein
MSLQLTDLESGTFAEMDQKAREVIEKRFGVRLDSAQSSERFQAAWDVYQNATVKILKALANEKAAGGESRLQDPAGYATVIARNSCRDFWRVHNPGWAELKGRLSRFFRKQPAYAMWSIDEQTGSICGPAGWKNRAVAPGARVSELIENPRRVEASYLPKIEVIQGQDAPAWARLLDGFFDYLGGPVRLDELVSIAGVFFGVRGSREMAFDELARGADGHAWDPPAGEPRPDAVLAVREQLRKVWTELRTMPKRWVMPFLLNPPVMKGSGRRMRSRAAHGTDDRASAEGGIAIDKPDEGDQRDRGEIAVFPSAGIASVGEIESLVAFKQEHYALLWSKLEVEARGGPPLASVSDPHRRFAVIWDRLPLEDEVIAAVMGLDSGQKVINLRMVAKNHLAKALAG